MPNKFGGGERFQRLTPRSLARLSAVLRPACIISACTTQRSSVPVRTATEELLISTAADRAAADAVAFDSQGNQSLYRPAIFSGHDDGYALNAIRTQIPEAGLDVVDDRSQAQAIVKCLLWRAFHRREIAADRHSRAAGSRLAGGHIGIGARNCPVQDGAGQGRRQIRRHRLRRQDRQADRHHRSAIWLLAPDQPHDLAVLLLGRPAIWCRRHGSEFAVGAATSPTAFPDELGFTGNIDRSKSH